jgi:hypothetical protein
LLHKAVVDGPDDLIEFTDAKGLRVVTPTYFEGVRTSLSVATTRGDLLQQQQATRRSSLMSSTSRPSSNAESEKLAFKLHASSHLSARDLERRCAVELGSCRLLCAAKDETSVDIMGRKLCGNFLRKS